MVVKVLYFGRLKELCGSAEESVDVCEGAAIKDLFSQCCAKVPAMRDYRSSVVASRNQEFASWETVLSAGDEIGFLPPVSGG